MSEESSSEEESLQVLSVQSDSKSDEDEPTPAPKKEKKKNKKKKSKHLKSSSTLGDSSRETVKKKKTKSKLIKGIDKLNLKKDKQKTATSPNSKSTKDKKLTKEPEKKIILQTDKKTEIPKPSPIDKSKLRYSQTNLAKIINKPLYDPKAEESISNILNRKNTSPLPPKSPSKTTSFTTKSYIDRSAAIIEADQTIKFKDQKPVLGQRISPEKMTKSVNIVVKHLYKNKKSLDINQLTQQDSKSIIKFSLSSSINEEGERFD